MNELRQQKQALDQRVSPLRTTTAVQTPAPGTRSTRALVGGAASLLVPYARYASYKIGHAGVIGLALFMFSLVIAFSATSPLRQQISAMESDLDNARAATSTTNHDDLPKVQSANAQRLVSALPSRNELPHVMGQIVTLASAAGLTLDRGNYDFAATDSNQVARYSMRLPVRGTYPQVRQFVENTLAALPAVALDSMRFERSDIASQSIEADLEFAVLVGGK